MTMTCGLGQGGPILPTEVSKNSTEEKTSKSMGTGGAEPMNAKPVVPERGLFIMSNGKGAYGVELRGVTLLEGYALITIIKEKLDKQLKGE